MSGDLTRGNQSHDLVLNLLVDKKWRLVYGDLHRVLLLSPESPERITWRPDFYQGQDLNYASHTLPAIQWLRLLIELGQAPLFEEAVKAFDRDQTMPCTLVNSALEMLVVNTSGNAAFKDALDLVTNLQARKRCVP